MDQPGTPTPAGAQEDEPERHLAGRPAPVKKPLATFLADFEERLRNYPDRAATGAQEAIRARAEGVWRTPVESSASRPPRSAAAELVETPPSTEEARAPVVADPAKDGAPAPAKVPTADAQTNAQSGAQSGEGRRFRGRHRRRHRRR